MNAPTDASPSLARLDANTTIARILSCSACFEPVVTSGWSGRVVARCGYCGFDDERELSLECAPPGGGGTTAYRGRPRTAGAGTKIEFDLDVSIPGVDFATIDGATLRKSFARRALIDDEQPVVEFERVWIGVFLARKFARFGDPLRARMTLETTLEHTRTSGYRVILLAHLAQYAAAGGATTLAEKWLAACSGVDVAEVDSEVRAARAMIAFANGEDDEVIDLTGGTRAGSGYSGGLARQLAWALAIAARERSGNRRAADAIVEAVSTWNCLPSVTYTMLAHGIDPAPLTRVARRARLRAMAKSALLSGGLFLLAPIARVAIVPAIEVAALIAITSAAIEGWTHDWPHRTIAQKARRFAVRWALPIGWRLAAGAWLVGHYRVPTEPVRRVASTMAQTGPTAPSARVSNAIVDGPSMDIFGRESLGPRSSSRLSRDPSLDAPEEAKREEY